MKRVIREHIWQFVSIVGLVAIAAAVGIYILDNQRLRFPWEDDPIRVRAAFSTAQAVTPGQGQTVRVAGVRIGDVAEVELDEGRAIIGLDIDREYEGLVRRDATALLRPRTGLKDMFIELSPGSKRAPVAEEDYVIPVSNTLPDVNPDEVLAAMDADTRPYVKLLLKEAADGLEGRGEDLREVLKRFEPTHRDLALVMEEVATRRTELRRLVRSLNLVSRELGDKDDELAQLVDSSATAFGTLARRRTEVSATVRRLPGTLRQATTALDEVEGMARELGPAADELRQVAPPLIDANRALRPLAREALPLLRDDIRPMVRVARPAVREVADAAKDLDEAEPGLLRSLEVLNHLQNMLGHNPRGAEDADTPGRDEGFLFHGAWGGHQLNGVFGWADAHGSGRKAVFGLTCRDYRGLVSSNPLAGIGLGLSSFEEPTVCGGAGPEIDSEVRTRGGDEEEDR